MADCTDVQLETARLILREPIPSDAIYIQPILNNWEIAKWLGALPFPYPKNGATEWIERVTTGKARGEKQTFMIYLKDETSVGPIGSLGLHRHDESQWGFGYWLGQDYWGKGFMSEAALPTIQFAMEVLQVTKLVSTYFKGNEASARILLRRGFEPVREEREWCEARGQKLDAVKLELTSEKWASQATELGLQSPPIC